MFDALVGDQAFSKDDTDPDFPQLSKFGVMADFATPDRPAKGNSFFSRDGGLTWQSETFADYSFGLVVAPR